MIRGLKRLLGHRGADAPADEPEAGATRVLMVCMGNICRSPLAEGVLRAKLERAGLGQRVLVDSAGTSGLHAQEPPDPRGIKAAAARGYDIGGLRARGFVESDFRQHELVLAMDEQNLAWLRRQAPPAARSELGLLLRHASRHPGVHEVPDPYYGPALGFEHVLDLIEDACDGLVAAFSSRAQHPKS